MSWKTAVVIPILKPDKNSALAESYRPISLLPVLSKLAEKVILARLNDHLERENILIPEQHGFRPRLSTSHQLLRVVEFIKEGNNKDECTAAVFLDIQKAFDRSNFVELQMLSKKRKRKLDLAGASEMNRLYPNSRRESGNENRYLNTPPQGEDGGRSGQTKTRQKYVTRAGMEERKEGGGLNSPKNALEEHQDAIGIEKLRNFFFFFAAG
ncbi:putative RNA-directed DNA polymerase from transposon BS [Trichonephila clavipes]|nr:putative RNA-directed DNA polymerase from transposon BS [Trichonephila clavipes]